MKCNHENCKSRPNFGYETAKFCLTHKAPDMKAIGIRFCKHEGCITKASYGYERPIRCKTHKKEDMKSFTKKYCAHEGCLKSPRFGQKGQKPTHCAQHRKEGMFNSIKSQCELCTTQSTFGFKNERTTRCGKHKEEGMIYLLFPQCPDCGTSARYGLVKNRPIYCSNHKTIDMWNVIDRTCKECNTRPTYGYTRADYCQVHMKSDMKVFTRNFCEEDGCSKTACCNTIGSKEALYCTSHARDGMINLWEKKCSICCSTRVREGYQGHCAHCFSHMFPDSPKIRKFKTKERSVKDFLVSKWPDSIITHDKAVDCFRFRPDFVIELGSHTIIIEVDEFQHRDYEMSCENKRLMSIFQGLGSRPMFVIRFNPDAYVDETGKKVQGCWHGSGIVKKGAEWGRRLKELERTIEKRWDSRPEKEVTIEYLFYTPISSSVPAELARDPVQSLSGSQTFSI